MKALAVIVSCLVVFIFMYFVITTLGGPRDGTSYEFFPEDTISVRIMKIYKITGVYKDGKPVVKFPDDYSEEAIEDISVEQKELDGKIFLKLRCKTLDDSIMSWNIKEAVEGVASPDRPKETIPTQSEDGHELKEEQRTFGIDVKKNGTNVILEAPRRYWVKLTKNELDDMVRSFLDINKINLSLDKAIDNLTKSDEIRVDGSADTDGKSETVYYVMWDTWESYRLFTMEKQEKMMVPDSNIIKPEESKVNPPEGP